MIRVLGDKLTWPMIGHLQRDKVKRALQLFDLTETVDSWRLAEALNRRCAIIDKLMPVLAEINRGREASKTGVLPEELGDLQRRVARPQEVHVQKLMTMGPRFGDPEQARPYFQATRAASARLSAPNLRNATMR